MNYQNSSLENNGYVAGVAWTDDYKNAKYELIHEYKELYRITQTKYFQPEMSEIFVQIKEKLDKGSKVLFIGTSCSNAGLKSFLNREYNNLYCCDLFVGDILLNYIIRKEFRN